MAPLSLLASRKKDSASRLTRNSKLFRTIIQSLQEKKAAHIISLDLRKISESVADFFVVCEADNAIQLRAIAENVEQQVKENCGENPYRHEGCKALQWILIDYVNIVVHVMLKETRKFYNLEEMWSDATLTGHEE